MTATCLHDSQRIIVVCFGENKNLKKNISTNHKQTWGHVAQALIGELDFRASLSLSLFIFLIRLKIILVGLQRNVRITLCKLQEKYNARATFNVAG